MNNKLSLIPVMFLLFISMVYAGTDIIMVGDHSQDPQDYVFWDDGDQIRNGTYSDTPLDDDLMTTQRWTTLSTAHKYESTTTKDGDLAIIGTDTRDEFFDFGADLDDVTFQITFFDNQADTSGVWTFGFRGNDFAPNDIALGIDTAVTNSNYFYNDGGNNDAGIDRVDGGINFTVYVASATAYVAGYINNTLVFNKTSNPDNLSFLVFDARSGFGTAISWDLMMIWNGTPEERPLVPSPSTPGFTITAIDFFNSSSINSFTVVVSNSTVSYTNSTTTGNINFENITNGNYTVTINSTESGGYFERIFNDINASNDLEAKLWQAIVYINASDIVDGTVINNFGVTTGGQLNISNSTGFATLRLNAKSHLLTGNASTYFLTTQNLSLSPLEEKFFNLQFGRNILSINATDILTNQSISSFTINVMGINISYDRTLSTTSGDLNFSLSNGNYTVIFSSETHATISDNITVDDNIENLTMQTFTINSIFIRIFNEGTINIIDFQEVTADFDSDDQVLNLSTGNGTIFAENLFPGLYTITIGSNGFNTRDYILNLLDSSNVQLNAFLINSTLTGEITFTIKDASTLINLDNVLVSVSDKINLTYVTIAQKTTDISGQVVFDLDQSKKYRFTLSRNDYETKTFDLTPSSLLYTINIDPSALIDYTTIYNEIDFLTLPISNYITTFGLINFSIITASLEGAVINFFGVNTTFDSILYKTNVSGSAAGGTASIEVNLNQSFSSIGVTFFIDVDGRLPYIIDRKFYLSNVSGGNNSLIGVQDQLEDAVPQVYLVIIGTFIVLLITATIASLGIRDRKLNVVAASTMGLLSLPGLQMFNPLISVPVIIILIASYFIGGNRSDDD